MGCAYFRMRRLRVTVDATEARQEEGRQAWTGLRAPFSKRDGRSK
jgi:hypothetical protein